MANIEVSGQGNIANVARDMSNVINTVNLNLNQSTASDDVKNLVKVLTEQVSAAAPKVDSGSAEQLGKNLEALSKELSSAKPQKRWYEVSLEGLKEAADAVGEIGIPIAKTVAKLMPLLLG